MLALDSAKVGRRSARQATGALRNHVLAYTGGGDPSEHSAGSYAKLVLVGEAQGADATAFGGGPRKDLVAGLLALECGKAPVLSRRRPGSVRGRLGVRRVQQHLLAVAGPDRAGAGDQPWSLARRGVLPDRPAVRQRRFPGDLRRGDLPVHRRRHRLRRAGIGSGRRRGGLAAAADGGRWLKRHQHDNGSFSGNGARNANSTGLAAQALTAVGRDNAAGEPRAVSCATCRSCAAARPPTEA